MKKQIPAITEIYCDVCKILCDKSNRPRSGHLDLHKDALDYGGCPVADGSYHLDLCDGCLDKIDDSIRAIQKAADALIETLKGKS